MGWKNQITKTPYLVLFIFLGAISIGTASALVTITLAGDVIVTDNLHVDQDLYVGTTTTNDWDTIFMDDGTESFFWNDGADWFEVSDDFNVDGVIDAGSQSVSVPYNRFGFHQTDHGLSGENDLFVHEDLEVDGDVYADGDIQCIDCIDSSDITNGAIQAEDIADGAAIKSITLSGEWFADSDEGGKASANMGSSTNSMCYLTSITFQDADPLEYVWDSHCFISNESGDWILNALTTVDEVHCKARCLSWD